MLLKAILVEFFFDLFCVYCCPTVKSQQCSVSSSYHQFSKGLSLPLLNNHLRCGASHFQKSSHRVLLPYLYRGSLSLSRGMMLIMTGTFPKRTGSLFEKILFKKILFFPIRLNPCFILQRAFIPQCMSSGLYRMKFCCMISLVAASNKYSV